MYINYAHQNPPFQNDHIYIDFNWHIAMIMVENLLLLKT